MKYYQLEDGEWIGIIGRRHRRACCDCGLIHDYEYRIVKGKIQYRAWRDNRATGQRRRWQGIVKLDDSVERNQYKDLSKIE